ncbi:ABC transporter substrate-binding protein [Rhizobium puerariae]|uniref:ABC transporter substrate-binding protein n=1 Tax=Rhizobium puerariae TaxID=1585791 RepID=A0ABV6AJD2_9HYPH
MQNNALRGPLLATVAVASALLLTQPAFAEDAGRTLTIATGSDIISLDPSNHGSTATSAVLNNVYDQLIATDYSTGRLVLKPNLAQSWEQTGPRTWVFTLRNDVNWQNGDHFTAEDVKFTIDRLKGNTKLRSYLKFQRITSATVIDPYNIQIETDGPDPELLLRFVGNGPNILPKKAVEAAGSDDAFFRNPVGTGPYRLKDWKKADRVTLVASDNWWGGKPKWKEVTFRAIPETTTRVAELITGGVDIATAVPPEDEQRIRATGKTHTVASNSARNCILMVRTSGDWVTANPKVREAIDLALDRDTIVKEIVAGLGVPSRGFFPPEIPNSEPALDSDFRYDAKKARELLAEAGFKDGVSLQFATTDGRYLKDKEVSETIAAYLEDVGIRTNLQVLDWTVYKDRQAADKFGELYFRCMGAYTHASTFLDRDWKEHIGWNNAKFEDVKKKALAETDPEARSALIRDVQKIVADDRAQIGIYYPKANFGVSDTIDYTPRFDEIFIAEEINSK